MIDERQRVDKCLERAKNFDFPTANSRAVGRFATACAEALMRAHRELDDDFWQVKERLERHGNDLAAALGSSPDDGTFYEPGIPAGIGDGGTILGEREIIDSVLNVAAKAIEMVKADDPGTASWMMFGLELVTANVRQIRDLDDTIVGVCEAIDAHAGKMAIAVSDFRQTLEPPPKKGLFG